MSYWEDRVKSEEYWVKALTDEKMKMLRRHYQEVALSDIEDELLKLYAQVKDTGAETLSRTQLYNFSRYRSLHNCISEQAYGIARLQNTTIKSAIEELYLKIRGIEQKDSVLTKHYIEQLINSKWSGKDFSERIWHNMNQLTQRVTKVITDSLILGMDYSTIATGISDEFNVSLNVANRLIRTETMHAYNTCAIDRYRDNGVKEIEILVESDACDDCLRYRGKKMPIDKVPILPIHCNCRCCYIPIIDYGLFTAAQTLIKN